MQMDCSSASSETLFHGLPSKSEYPSIRKHSLLLPSQKISEILPLHSGIIVVLSNK